jgi:hypothetical protein
MTGPAGCAGRAAAAALHDRREASMSTSEKRILVTPKLNKKQHVKLLMSAWNIYNAWLANTAQLPTPVPSLVAFLALLQAFDTAQQQAGSKDKLAIETRNAKALLVVSAIEAWQALLQGACDANPAMATQLIAAGAMFVRGTGKRNKPLIAVSLVPGQPGTVEASANATLLTGGTRQRPTFNWQSSADAKTIASTSSTPHAETTFPSVPMLSTLYVRVSVTLGKTTSDWSQWVSVLVH